MLRLWASAGSRSRLRNKEDVAPRAAPTESCTQTGPWKGFNGCPNCRRQALTDQAKQPGIILGPVRDRVREPLGVAGGTTLNTRDIAWTLSR